MAASVRIEDEAFADARIAALGGIAGYNHYEALGRMSHLWRLCTQRGIYVVSEVLVCSCLGRDGVAAILGAELGERVDGGIRIKGTDGRIEWLEVKRAGSVAGGKARAAKAKRESGGQFTSSARLTPADAGDAGSSSASRTPGNTSPPAPAPAPDVTLGARLSRVDVMNLGSKLHEWAMPYGPAETELNTVCPMTREEFDAAAATTLSNAAKPGFAYFASVVATNRRPRAPPRQERSAFRDVTEEVLREARERDQRRLLQNDDSAAGLLPAKIE